MAYLAGPTSVAGASAANTTGATAGLETGVQPVRIAASTSEGCAAFNALPRIEP